MTSLSLTDSSFISVLVVNLDYKLLYSKRDVGFIKALDSPLPTIRVYGSTDKGQRICVHLHGVLPYIYIRPDSMNNAVFESEEKVERLLPGMEKTLEDLLHAKRAKTSAAHEETGSKNVNKKYQFKHRRLIHALEVVRRKTMYGMYVDPLLFIKVTLRDPADCTRLAAILEDVQLSGISMQSYESHIPYLLQFTSDYNVSPMGWLLLTEDIKFRHPLPPDEPVFPPPAIQPVTTTVSDEMSRDGNADHTEDIASTPVMTPSSQKSLSDEQLFTSPSHLFLTAKSPVKGTSSNRPVHSDAVSSTSSSLELHQRSLSLSRTGGGMFTQSTVPNQCLWNHQCVHQQVGITEPVSDEVDDDEDVSPHNDGTEEDVTALLDGITSDMLVWSQYPQANPPQSTLVQEQKELHHDSTVVENRREEQDTYFLQVLSKESCCELEIDAHCSHIINATMLRTAFGAELWEEERIRCEQKGLVMEETAEPASTQTVHRVKQQVELNFTERYHNLAAKGRALQQVGCELVQSESYAYSTSLSQYIVPSPLSGKGGICSSPALQYNKSPDAIKNDIAKESPSRDKFAIDSQSPGFCTPLRILKRTTSGSSQLSDSDLHEWAKRRIRDVENSVDLDNRQSECLLSEESQRDTVQEFIKSQHSSPMTVADRTSLPKRLWGIATLHADGDGEGDDDNEDEEELSAQQEVLDIFSSTQQPLEECAKDVMTADKEVVGISESDTMALRPVEEPVHIDRKDVVGNARKPPLIPVRAGGFKAKVNVQYESPVRDGAVDAFNSSADKDIRATISIASAFSVGKKRKVHQSPGIRFAEEVMTTDSVGVDSSENNVSSSTKKRNKLRRTVSFKDTLPQSEDYLDRHVSTAVSSPIASLPAVVQSSRYQSPIVQSSVSALTDIDLLSAPNYIVKSSQKQHKTDLLHMTSPLCLLPTFTSPSASSLASMSSLELADMLHIPAHYSDRRDVEVVGTNVTSNMTVSRHPVKYGRDFAHFDGGFPLENTEGIERPRSFWRDRMCLIPSIVPPHPAKFWSSNLKVNGLPAISRLDKSQIATPTQTPHTPDHLVDQNVGAGAITKRLNRLTVFSAEIHCNTRTGLLPNPRLDAVQTVCWVVEDMVSNAEAENSNRLHGVISVVGGFQEGSVSVNTVNPSNLPVALPVTVDKNAVMENQRLMLSSYGLPKDSYFHVVEDEHALFAALISAVHNIDPDFLIGYELQNSSFGYLVKRGKVLEIDMNQLLSKMPSERSSYRNEMDDDLIDGHESKLFITGRVVLNMWQRMRDELKLFSYTYSNVSAHLLGKRVPYFTHSQLTRWYRQTGSRGFTMRHLHRLAELNVTLMNKIDLMRKTSEMARLYGIDFFSVLSRGSQYRVEAALIAKARSMGFVLLSPSRRRVASQAAMECIPLVMEPRSRFYHDPVVVLDFQSLYPSMMLAYNLCFSTCFGKLKSGLSGEVETTEALGTNYYSELQSAFCASLHSDEENFSENGVFGDDTPFVAPNGSLFCAKNVRMGVLPLMVKEMLDTRVMVKRAMKRHKNTGGSVLQKVLDARQLAIKLLSNVTYGYAAAGFSGRMPMAELADAIVQSGRSTLEWTTAYINSHPTWNANVVYGDTDSVFIELKGRSREEAFRIGLEISESITSKCPANVVLKFEKVYLPCILVTKKRYVGYSYETVTQKVAHLDAKGIEVVRRDQCLATVKMQEKCIRTLFETKDLSQVKAYLYAQWDKMLQGGDRLLLRDFVFSKEVRFGHYASVSSQPPGSIVATKAVLIDEMAVPPYNWRVPYVVVSGIPNAPLKHLVYSPEEVLRRGSSLRLNYVYYISKCINPALDRVLSLCGADVFAWFKAMPRPKIRLRHINYDTIAGAGGDTNTVTSRGGVVKNKQTLMDQFTVQGSCSVCGEDAQPQKTLCARCSHNKMTSLVLLMERLNVATRKDQDMTMICHNCAKFAQCSVLYSKGDIMGHDCCESLDCELFFERSKLITRIEDYRISVSEIEELP